MSDSNSSFWKILRKQENKKRRKKAEREPYTGDTETGRAMAHGVNPSSHLARKESAGNFRTFRQNPGATKGRGKFGGIR